MVKPKIKFEIIKEEKGYSAYSKFKGIAIFTQGETWNDLKANIKEASELALEEKGYSAKLADFQYSIDLKGFFENYKVLNAKVLSTRLGMNQSLLAQYIKGIKKPSPKQTTRILRGIQQLGRELVDIQFII